MVTKEILEETTSPSPLVIDFKKRQRSFRDRHKNT